MLAVTESKHTLPWSGCVKKSSLMSSYSGRRVVPLPENWQAIRRVVLLRDRHRCQWGMLPGEQALDGIARGQCSSTATEVDHMGAASDHNPDFLRAICHEHHKRRTSMQANAARSRKLKMLNGKFANRPVPKHPGMR